MFQRNLSFTLVALAIFTVCFIAARKAQASGIYQSGMIPGHVDQYSMSIYSNPDDRLSVYVSINTKYEITSMSHQLWVNPSNPTHWTDYVSFGLNLSSTAANESRNLGGGYSSSLVSMYQSTYVSSFEDGGGKGLVENALGDTINYGSGSMQLAPADCYSGYFSVYDYDGSTGGEKGFAAVSTDLYSSIYFTFDGTFTGPKALEVGQHLLSMQQNVPEPSAWILCSILPLSLLMKRTPRVALCRA